MSATNQTLVLECLACNAKNRVPISKLQQSRQPVCGRCKSPLPNKTLSVSDASFASIVEQSALPVLVDMWAPWCGPCRAIAPVLEQIATELAGRIIIAKLNVDENPQTASRFRVASIPTLLLFKNGQQLERINGALPKPELMRMLGVHIL